MFAVAGYHAVACDAFIFYIKPQTIHEAKWATTGNINDSHKHAGLTSKPLYPYLCSSRNKVFGLHRDVLTYLKVYLNSL